MKWLVVALFASTLPRSNVLKLKSDCGSRSFRSSRRGVQGGRTRWPSQQARGSELFRGRLRLDQRRTVMKALSLRRSSRSEPILQRERVKS